MKTIEVWKTNLRNRNLNSKLQFATVSTLRKGEREIDAEGFICDNKRQKRKTKRKSFLINK